MELDEGLWADPGIFPTASIFYYDQNARLGVMRWQPTGVDSPILPANAHSIATICSSCDGLVACRFNESSTYHVGNPYLSERARNIVFRYYDLPDSPTFHDPDETQVVLAVFPNPAYLVVCAFRGMYYVPTFETFDSATNSWESVQSRFNQHGETIVPNSGVSCDRIAYWLVSDSTRTPTYVLRFRFRDAYYPSMTSLFNLPPGVRGRARMQLGRVMGGLGLVFVSAASSGIDINEASPRVELYTLNEHAANIDGLWSRFELINLEVPQADDEAAGGDDWVASWRQEDMTIVCREMPRPIRFDSFKVELLFWVHGRVLQLENSSLEPHVYRMAVLPGNWPASITDGLPHVDTGFQPIDFPIFHPRSF